MDIIVILASTKRTGALYGRYGEPEVLVKKSFLSNDRCRCGQRIFGIFVISAETRRDKNLFSKW